MPVVARMDLPRPADWQEFEVMTAASLRSKWLSPNLQMHGRPGQAQQGVDIYGPDDLGRPTGVQCKLTTGQISVPIVEDELAKSIGFGTPLSTLYVATTQDFDSVLQQQVRALSLTRCQAGQSAVGVLFWHDIVDGLCLNPTVFQSFYPQIDLSGMVQATSFERMSWCVELGYYGPHLWKFVELVMGELGLMVGEDPDQIRVLIETLKVHVTRTLPETAGDQVRGLLDEMATALFPPAGPADGARAKRCSSRITSRVQQVLTILPARDAQSVRLGMRLGAAYISDDDMTDSAFGDAVATIKTLLGPESNGVVDEQASIIASRSPMNRPQSLYNLFLREATRRALG